MSEEQDWAALGRHVEARRRRMALSRKQVADRGGPSDFTLARVERGEPGPYRGKTLVQLERALSMKEGAVERILDGTATDEDLNDTFAYAGVARGVGLGGTAAAASSGTGELTVNRGELGASLPAARANLGGLVATAGGTDHLRELVDDVTVVDSVTGDIFTGGALVSVRYSVESALAAVGALEQTPRLQQIAQALGLARQLLSEEMHRQSARG